MKKGLISTVCSLLLLAGFSTNLPTIKLKPAPSHLNFCPIATGPIVPITSYNSAVYYGEVGFGTPPQKLKMVFNSVESDIWLPSKRCKTLGCLPHAKYDSKASSTYKKDGREYSLNIDDTQVEATISVDSVTIAGLTVKNQAFGEIDQMPLKYANDVQDGVIGFGFDYFTPYKLPTLFDQIFSQKLIDDNSFSFYVNPKRTGESALVLGGIDKKYYTGDMNYHSLVDHRYLWAVELKDVRIGEKSVKPTEDTIGVAMTGFGFTLGSSEIITPITDEIGATGQIDCNKVNDLPNFAVQIGEWSYDVPPQNYILKITSFSQTVCIVGFIGAELTPVLGPTVILGGNFMSMYYTHFDLGGMRLGFGKATVTE